MSISADGGQLQALVDAVWQVLDDMAEKGKCCCGAAKAELRIAFEPFRVQIEADDPGACDGFMPLEAAQSIIKECRY